MWNNCVFAAPCWECPSSSSPHEGTSSWNWPRTGKINTSTSCGSLCTCTRRHLFSSWCFATQIYFHTNSIQRLAAYRHKALHESTEDSFGRGLTLLLPTPTTLYSLFVSASVGIFPVLSFFSEQLSSVVFHSGCVFTPQGGHYWWLKGSEGGCSWRRHIYELGPGDGKAMFKDPNTCAEPAHLSLITYPLRIDWVWQLERGWIREVWGAARIISASWNCQAFWTQIKAKQCKTPRDSTGPRGLVLIFISIRGLATFLDDILKSKTNTSDTPVFQPGHGRVHVSKEHVAICSRELFQTGTLEIRIWTFPFTHNKRSRRLFRTDAFTKTGKCLDFQS